MPILSVKIQELTSIAGLPTPASLSQEFLKLGPTWVQFWSHLDPFGSTLVHAKILGHGGQGSNFCLGPKFSRAPKMKKKVKRVAKTVEIRLHRLTGIPLKGVYVYIHMFVTILRLVFLGAFIVTHSCLFFG